MYEFIYLLQTRESLKNNENIFKIGRTCQPELCRFNDYPKGSILHLHISCINSTDIERKLIKNFNEHFQNINDYGKEYFEGNMLDMMSIISKEVGLSYDNLSTSFDFCKKLQQMESKNEQLIDKINAEVNENEQLMKRIKHEMQKNEILQKELFDMTNEMKDYKNTKQNLEDIITTKSHTSNIKLNYSQTIYECNMCKKILCDKRSYLYHINICKGVNSKTCHICLKEFSSLQGKHNHLKNVKCKPIV